ncbi:MAG: hypothetical protein H6923_09535 [Alphaproteobacteria bacterium]|nr:hypothetical protein [Alphaproteobacteria bacterium]
MKKIKLSVTIAALFAVSPCHGNEPEKTCDPYFVQRTRDSIIDGAATTYAQLSKLGFHFLDGCEDGGCMSVGMNGDMFMHIGVAAHEFLEKEHLTEMERDIRNYDIAAGVNGDRVLVMFLPAMMSSKCEDFLSTHDEYKSIGVKDLFSPTDRSSTYVLDRGTGTVVEHYDH